MEIEVGSLWVLRDDQVFEIWPDLPDSARDVDRKVVGLQPLGRITDNPDRDAHLMWDYKDSLMTSHIYREATPTDLKQLGYTVNRLCPKCEKREPDERDYLCLACRYGLPTRETTRDRFPS
jgi:hypothetical protein